MTDAPIPPQGGGPGAEFPRNRTRAVFLDAGLTLLHPDPPVERVYAEAFAEHGVEASVEDVHRALHTTWRAVAERQARGEERWGGPGGEAGFWRRFVETIFATLGGGEMPGPLLARLVAHFQSERHWALFPEVNDVLESLSARGLRLAVVSNWDSSLPSLLERLDLARRFDAIVVSSIVGVSKPARGIFDEALRLVNVSANEALHVGDSAEEDYAGAIEAGLAALLLDRKGRGREGCETITSLTEILSRLC